MAFTVEAGQVISSTVVEHVRVRPGVAYVKFEACSKYSRVYINTEYDKAMYSTALAAGVGKQSVSVEFNGPDCSLEELEMLYLDIKF